MAIDTTNATARLCGEDPKSDPIRHVRLEIQGDSAYPTGGTPGALQFVRDLIKAKDPKYDTSGSTANAIPIDFGEWIERSTIMAFQDLDENLAGAAKVIYDRTNDTLFLKNRADDTELAAADQSAKLFAVLVHLQ